jgi:hypothetical protein
MLSSDSLFSSNVSLPRHARIVPARISAIQLFPGRHERGLVTQLPQSADVEICGDGFNDRTVKVRWHDSFYFVFRDDLEIVVGKN